MSIRKVAAVVFAVLIASPLPLAPSVFASPVDPDAGLDVQGGADALPAEAAGDCPGTVELPVGPGDEPVENATERDRFAVVTIRGGTGPLSVGGADVGSLVPDEVAHVVLKTTEAERSLVFGCIEGGTANVTYLDAPIVEVVGPPARVIAPTFTRPGLRALSMDNLLEIYVATPTGGEVEATVSSDGTPMPSTLQAFGEDPNGTATAWTDTAERITNDSEIADEIADVLGRLAVFCNRGPNEAVLCTGTELEHLLARYGVPAPAARDLANRLATDQRCTVIEMTDIAGIMADLFNAVENNEVPEPTPCGGVVSEWASDTFEDEMGFSPQRIANASARALGLQGVGTGGPCGDEVGLRGSVNATVRGSAANRTMPSRQIACAEQLVSALRPIRYMWQSGGMITEMGSLDYGSARLRLDQPRMGEAKLTVSSQGPVMLDVEIDLLTEDSTVGDAAQPARDALDAAGAPPPETPLREVDRLLRKVDRLLDEYVPVGPTPSTEELLHDIEQIETDGSAVEQTVTTATDLSNEITSPVIRDLLNRTPQRCTAGTGGVGPGCDDVGADAPAELSPPEATTIWSREPADEMPAQDPLPYDPRDAESAIDAFLAPPGTPLTPRSTDAGITADTEDRRTLVFVPDRLDVRFDDPPQTETGLDPLDDQPGTGDALSEADALRDFAEARVRDLRETLDDEGVPTLEDASSPVEIVLTGTTFHVRHEDGDVTVLRTDERTFRLVNLREGVERGDLDLDGATDGLEARSLIPDAFVGGVVEPRMLMDPTNPDSDADGMPDGWEFVFCDDADQFPNGRCTDSLVPWRPAAAGDDVDDDLMPDVAEYARSFRRHENTSCFETARWSCIADAAEDVGCDDPRSMLPWSEDDDARDTDCDGFLDGWESRAGFDPIDPDDPVADGDPDDDGLTNREEHDHFVDLVRLYMQRKDVSWGEAVDAVSTAGDHGHLIAPTRTDTDGDGLPDGYEVVRGLDESADRVPLVRRLLPMVDDADEDPDADGMTTREEFEWSLKVLAAEQPDLTDDEMLTHLNGWGLDPFDADTDDDGVDDGVEVAEWEDGDPCSDPLSPNVDCDGDGIDDLVERAIADDDNLTEEDKDAALGPDYPCVLAPSEMANRSIMNRTSIDSDGDGIHDGYECWFGLDPTFDDASNDTDGDGLTNGFEHELTLRINPEHRNDPAYFENGTPGAERALLPNGSYRDFEPVDHDGDGLPDSYEVALGLDPLALDAKQDPDADGLRTIDEFNRTPEESNGLSAKEQLSRDVDAGLKDADLLESIRSFRLDPTRADSDGDRMADGWEAHFDLDPFTPATEQDDADGDGLPDAEEYTRTVARHADLVRTQGPKALIGLDAGELLDPLHPDSDGDGMPDGPEARYRSMQGCTPSDTVESGHGNWSHCIDPLDPSDTHHDLDDDGLTNREELVGWNVVFVAQKTSDPVLDGERQLESYHVRSNPLTADSSGDGMSDRQKAPHRYSGCDFAVGLDPMNRDTDGDGVTDRVEMWEWTAVRGISSDIDGDCYPNAADRDSDGDSYKIAGEPFVDLSDGNELDLKMSDPTRSDTDSDGAPDGRELHQWRAAGRDPLDEDVDDDGKRPLRDPDSDGDGIQDGYEFWTGLRPWEDPGEDHDTDGDELTDLCEYRLTVRGRTENVCPDPAAGSDGSAAGASTPTTPDGSGATTADGDDHPLADEEACIDAANDDCDGDGIQDGFEQTHGHLDGCDPETWTHQAPGGELSECAHNYAQSLKPDAESRLRDILTSQANAPQISGIFFEAKYDIAPSNKACFYHRQCRIGLHITSDTRLIANIVVDDAECDLSHINLSVGTRHVGPSRLGERRDSVWDSPVSDAQPTWEATSQDQQDCVEAREAGDPPRYTARIVLPEDVLETQDLRRLRFGGRTHIDVIVEDENGNMGQAFTKDLDIEGRGFDFLEDLNNDLAEDIKPHRRQVGDNILRATGQYFTEVVVRARQDPSEDDIAQIRDYSSTALDDYIDRMEWFGTRDYEQTLKECHPDADPDDPQAWVIDRCDEVEERLKKAMSARMRYAVGTARMRDMSMPVAEGLARGSGILLESGAGHKHIAGKVRDHFGPAFGISPQADPMDFWDWLAPSIARSARNAGCQEWHTSMNAFRAQAPDPPTVGSGDPDAEAVQRFNAAAETLPGVAEPRWNARCIEESASTMGGDQRAARLDAVFLGVDAAGIGMDVAGTPDDLRNAHTARGKLGLGSTALGIAWFIFSLTVEPDSTAGKVAMFTGCLIVGSIGLGAAIVSEGAALPVVIELLGVAGCSTYFIDDSDEPQATPVPEGERKGPNYSWEWEITTYPDTKRDGDDPLSSDRPDAELARVELDITRPTTAFCKDDFFEDTPGYMLRSKGYQLAVGVERSTGTGWTTEGYLRYAERKDGGWYFADWTEVGVDALRMDSDWEIRRDTDPDDHDVQLEMTFHGEKEPGLLRFRIVMLPQYRVEQGDDPSEIVDDTFPDSENDGYVYPTLDHVSSIDPTTPPVKPSLPYGIPELAPGALFEKDYADCGDQTLRTEAALLRGVGVESVPTKPPTDPAVINVKGDGLTRTFDAVGSPFEAGHRYFWDLGDTTEEAIVTDSPGEEVSHGFSPGDQTVVLTIVDEHGRVVARGQESFVANAPSEWSLTPSRSGDRANITGRVWNNEVEVTYELQVGDRTITPDAPAKEHRFAVEEPIPSGGLPVKLTLNDPTGDRVVRDLVMPDQGPSTNALDDGHAKGEFAGRYGEVDEYTLDVASGEDDVALRVAAQPGHRVSAKKADGSLTRWRTVSLDQHTLELARSFSDDISGTWYVRVFSEGVKGTYEITVTGRNAPSPSPQDPGTAQPGPDLSPVDDFLTQPDPVIWEEDFSSAGDLQSRDLSGDASWGVRGWPFWSSNKVLHMGSPFLGGYDAYEDDTVAFSVELGEADLNGPLQLRFSDMNLALDTGPFDRQTVTVHCTGFDIFGLRRVTEKKVEDDLSGYGWVTDQNSYDFRCDDGEIASGAVVWVSFRFQSGAVSWLSPLSQGWVIDDLSLRRST